MDFEHVAEAIELPDNSGRHRVVFRPRGLSGKSIVTDVTITTESIDEDRRSEHTLSAFPILRSKLIRLEELLTVWLADRSPLGIDLAQERGSHFSLTVSLDPNYISSDEKPACRIDTNWCGVAAVAVHIVVQSCMRLFHEGVTGWLRLTRAAEG